MANEPISMFRVRVRVRDDTFDDSLVRIHADWRAPCGLIERLVWEKGYSRSLRGVRATFPFPVFGMASQWTWRSD